MRGGRKPCVVLVTVSAALASGAPPMLTEPPKYDAPATTRRA
jgi:hypothetical protein